MADRDSAYSAGVFPIRLCETFVIGRPTDTCTVIDRNPTPPLDRLRSSTERNEPTHISHVARLFSEHNRSLIAFLYSKLNSLADAQEVAQETYVRLLRLGEPERISFQKALLFRVAANLCVDRIRMRRVREQAEAEETLDQSQDRRLPEDPEMGYEKMRIVQRALAELPAKTSRAFVLHVLEGKDIASIAKTLNLTARMVRYHIANALAYCRTRVEEGKKS